ncbi:HNH endonuclease [Bacillus sp. ISL-37]|nr:HNH endonuclease [Bacillus sp. ISL-37]
MDSYSGDTIGNGSSAAAVAENGSLFALALKQQAAENHLETINDHLVNSFHTETGVPFMEQQVESNSNSMVGVFPAFDSHHDVQLPIKQYLASDHVQFKTANRMLYADILYDPSIADALELTNQEIEDLIKGITPEGYTWHHNKDSGSLQLVIEAIHTNTAHTDGRELWGGGDLYR